MTLRTKTQKKRHIGGHTARKYMSGARTLAVLAVLFISVLFSEEISRAVGVGLRISVTSIIPSVFPFMVLSSFLAAYGEFDRLTPLRKCFERLFHISGTGVSAFLAGVFCGYPLGVKTTTDLYKNRLISKEEAERLIGFSNNTGPAFLIYGIGAGMRGSIRDGVLLYLSLLLSAIAVGVIFGIGKRPSEKTGTLARPEFDMVSAIKDAGMNTLTVCSFLTFFSVVAGVLFVCIGNELVLAFALPFLEVGNAASFLSTAGVSEIQSLALTAFATGFSGISVHMQAESFLLGTDIRTKKYYLMKLLQGLISALLILLFSFI